MQPGSQFTAELSTPLVPSDPLSLPTGFLFERERGKYQSCVRWNLHWVHWVGPLLGAACAALSCHVLLYPVDEEEDGVGEEKGRKGNERRGQRNAVYRAGGGDSEEAPLCVSLSTSQLLQKSAGSTRPLNRSMSGGPEWRGEGEGSRERRETQEGRLEERELRREVGATRGEKEEREVEGVDKHSGTSSGYMSGPPGRSR